MNVGEWSRIRELHQSGMPIKAIARHLGRSRNTVRRALAAHEPPEDRRRLRSSAGDKYQPLIDAILAENPRATATEVARQIGWQQSMTVLRERIRTVRRGDSMVVSVTPERVLERLPAEATSFVGRRQELRAIKSDLESTRLLTLTGCGGVGKTRLARRAGEQLSRAFADGIRLVELASLRDQALLGQTFVAQLGLAHHDGAVTSPEEILADYFRSRQTLLIVDNCEHVIEGCRQLIGYLLVNGSDLTTVATSREALGIPGERLFLVRPLAVPATRPHRDDDDPAVALFASRAAAVIPGFTLTEHNDAPIREVCRQLDGLPLAIELAAIRLRVLSVNQLSDQLGERVLPLSARGGDAADRHRSLEATIDWSYDLCSPTEQKVWARCAIFAGGFELGACEQVCGSEDLNRAAVVEAIDGLVAKSILQREESDGRIRFGMLEPIREAGRSRLAPADVRACQRRHLDWYAGLIRELAGDWFGASQEKWVRRIQLEEANLRAAVKFSLASGQLSSARCLAADAWFLWAILSLKEHRHWLETVLDAGGEESPDQVRILATLSFVCSLQGDRGAAIDYLQRRDALAHLSDDDRRALPFAVHVRGLAHFFAGELASCRELLLSAQSKYEQSVVAPELVGSLHIHLGLLGVFDGQLDWAEDQLRGVLARCERSGERWIFAYATTSLALVELVRGHHDEAARLLTGAIAAVRGFRDATAVSLAVDVLAWAEAARDRHERSAVMLGAASTMWQSFGEQLWGSEQWLAQRAKFAHRARAGLGESSFERTFSRGTAMTRDQTIEYALDLRWQAAPAARSGSGADLTAREREVVELVGVGMTNKQIASKLVVSPRTAEGHVGNALRKLGLEHRAQLAIWVSTRSSEDTSERL
jgi:predicted ATPase/DNA-binding NarL/FixJ family response regulator